MITRLAAFFFFMLFMVGAAFGDKKAKVITESGKKWDVVFLRMSNDTVYLKARKANGALFSISGHKSKFRKIDFLDGSTLDLTLSNYPPLETPIKSRDMGEYRTGQDSAFRNQTSPAPVPEAPFSFARTQQPDSALSNFVNVAAKPDSAAASARSADTAFSSGSREIGLPTTPMKTDTASEAALSVETKPAKASIEIDDRPVEGTTPLIIHHLAAGRHRLHVRTDSLETSMHVTLFPGKIETVKLQLENEKSVKPIATNKKKRHTLALSVCLLSAAAFAGSAASYYLFTDDHKKSEEAYASLERASVLGRPAGDLLIVNQSKHDAAQQKLKFSQMLLGAAAALLVGGVVLYF